MSITIYILFSIFFMQRWGLFLSNETALGYGDLFGLCSLRLGDGNG